MRGRQSFGEWHLSALLPFLGSLLVTAGLLGLFLRIKVGMPMDTPNSRSLHSTPVPRIGGVALLSGTLSGWWFGLGGFNDLAALAVALATLSYVDDYRGLPTIVRLVSHLAAASLCVWFTPPAQGMASALLVVLAIVWMTNLFNFMDGANGLAGGMAVFGFGGYAAAAWAAGHVALAGVCGCIAAASAGFLIFNFDPARVFLGDAGSIPLGFLAGGLGYHGMIAEIWPAWWPALVFAPFVVDASTTLLRRLWRRERVWEAHREHYYQRLIRMGWSHRRTALSEYALMALCSIAALAVLAGQGAEKLWIVGTIAALHLLAMAAIDRQWQKKEATSTR